MSAVVLVLLLTARVSTLPVVGENMFPPWFEPTPAARKPAAVVHP